jgi:hypothetical protein
MEYTTPSNICHYIMRGSVVRSLSLRPFCSLASWAGRDELSFAPHRRLHPGFQPSGHPSDCRISLRRHTGTCAGGSLTRKSND